MRTEISHNFEFPDRSLDEPDAHEIVRPEDFGALGDGDIFADTVSGTDDWLAFVAALDYLHQLGGGTLTCRARTYRLDRPLPIMGDSISFEMLARTGLDFRGVPWYTNGSGAFDTLDAEGDASTPQVIFAPIASQGVAPTLIGRRVTMIISGTWVGTITLQKSIVDQALGQYGAWTDVTTYTTNGTKTYDDTAEGTIVLYRAIFKTGQFTSGAAIVNGKTNFDGLLLASGERGTAVTLTNNTYTSRVPWPAFNATAGGATRVGTTVTANTDLPHGFAVGDLIWIIADPALSDDDDGDPEDTDPLGDQGVFFTVFNRGVGRTTPQTVVTIPSTTQFTYTVTDTGATAWDPELPTYIFPASDVVQVADTSAFGRGDKILVCSHQERGRDNEHVNIGEITEVGKVLSSTQLRLISMVRDNYLTASPYLAKLFPLTLKRGIHIKGGLIRGKGANLSTVSGQRGDTGIMLRYVDGFSIVDTEFRDLDLQSGQFISCINGRIENPTIWQDMTDQGGGQTGTIDIQYGFNYGMACENISFIGGQYYGGRHAIVQGGSSGDTEFGVARNINYLGVRCFGQWLEAMSTHQSADTISWIGCEVIGARGGINPRYARNIVIEGCIIDVDWHGIMLYNDVINFIIKGNKIKTGYCPIRCYHIDNPTHSTAFCPTVPAGPGILIEGNDLIGGDQGIYIVDHWVGLHVDGITVLNNTIRNVKGEGIYIDIGTDAADGWTGSVCGNSFYNCNTIGTRQHVRLRNAKRVKFNDNTIEGTQGSTQAVLFDGDGSDANSAFDNKIASTTYTVFPVRFNGGTGHSTDAGALVETCTIASGVAAVTLLSSRYIAIDTEASAATDDLDTITPAVGQRIGDIISFRALTALRATTVRDSSVGGGNIQTAGNASRVLDSSADVLQLLWAGAFWNEVSFSSN